MVLNQRQFCLLEICLVGTNGEERMLLGEAGDAANHTPMHKTAHTTKDYPVQNVSGVKAGETMLYTLSLRVNNQETDLGNTIP